MAQVTSGVRTPSANRGSQSQAVGASNRFVGTPGTAPLPPQPDTMAALGLSPEEVERRRQQTGVDPGATGYVSGQVRPGGQAMAALNAATAPKPAESAYNPFGQVGGVLATTSPAPTGTPSTRQPPPGDTTTTSALTSGGAPPAAGTPPPPVGAGWRPAGAPGGDVTTRTSALTGGDTGAPPPNRTGTTTNTPVVTTGNQALDRVADPGGIFTGPTFGDTGPAVGAMNATFGLSDDLSRERFDYRPGAAASQDAVSLDKAQADETRARQQRALDALTAAADGTVPSAAELQMRQEAGRNVAATLGQARALGGRSAGGAARAGTLASADILARTNVEGAALRAAEQDRNRQALQQALGGVRSQDIDTAGRDAQLLQDQRQNNLRAQLEQNELAERHRLALLDSQLKALGIGTGAAGSILGAGAANAGAQNRFNAGVLGTVGDAIG